MGPDEVLRSKGRIGRGNEAVAITARGSIHPNGGLSPEILETRLAQRRVSGPVRDGNVAEPVLNGAGVDLWRSRSSVIEHGRKQIVGDDIRDDL
jgi:hypothetical protein